MAETAPADLKRKLENNNEQEEEVGQPAAKLARTTEGVKFKAVINIVKEQWETIESNMNLEGDVSIVAAPSMTGEVVSIFQRMTLEDYMTRHPVDLKLLLHLDFINIDSFIHVAEWSEIEDAVRQLDRMFDSTNRFIVDGPEKVTMNAKFTELAQEFLVLIEPIIAFISNGGDTINESAISRARKELGVKGRLICIPPVKHDPQFVKEGGEFNRATYKPIPNGYRFKPSYGEPVDITFTLPESQVDIFVAAGIVNEFTVTFISYTPAIKIVGMRGEDPTVCHGHVIVTFDDCGRIATHTYW